MMLMPQIFSSRETKTQRQCWAETNQTESDIRLGSIAFVVGTLSDLLLCDLNLNILKACREKEKAELEEANNNTKSPFLKRHTQYKKQPWLHNMSIWQWGFSYKQRQEKWTLKCHFNALDAVSVSECYIWGGVFLQEWFSSDAGLTERHKVSCLKQSEH